MVYLVGDIGGTNTRLGLSESPTTGVFDIFKACNDDFASLNAVVAHYLSRHGSERPRAACFAIASAVTGNQIYLTNRPDWPIDKQALAGHISADQAAQNRAVLLINDFEALALSLPYLAEEESVYLCPEQAATLNPVGIKAVIGPGTGLGVGALTLQQNQNGEQWTALPSEGGHISLSITNEREFLLQQTIQKQKGYRRMSVERAVSGKGLVNLYQAHMALEQKQPKPYSDAEITQAALNRSDPDAVATLEQFCRWLLLAAADLALVYLPTGGLYIGGGISAHIRPWLERPSSWQTYISESAKADLLAQFPLILITAPDPALTGASAAAQSKMKG